MKSGCRELVIKTAQQGKGVIDVTFHESCVGITMGNTWLRKQGIVPEDLAPNRSVFIKGRRGNEDYALVGSDVIESITLMPMPAPVDEADRAECDPEVGRIRTVIGKDGGRGTMVLIS